jgi:hypothetical protein
MPLFFTVKASREAAVSNLFSIASILSIETLDENGNYFSGITLNSDKKLCVIQSVNEIHELISNAEINDVVQLVEFIPEEPVAEFGWPE